MLLSRLWLGALIESRLAAKWKNGLPFSALNAQLHFLAAISEPSGVKQHKCLGFVTRLSLGGEENGSA